MRIRTFIDAAFQAPIIVTFNAPADAAYDFPKLYRRVREKCFILYPGKLTSVGTVRVGCICDIDPGAIRRALAAKSVRHSGKWV